MRKPQALKFWRALEDSTEISDVLRRYANKRGYGGVRTLGRYVQAHRCFAGGLSIREVVQRTGWSEHYVGKIQTWWSEEYVQKKVASLPQQDSLADALAAKEHREKLLKAFDYLTGIQPFSVHDKDLTTWWSRPNEPSWPVPKGQVWRRTEGGLRVELHAETRTEWPYLLQHLPHDSVRVAINSCKEAMAEDISCRGS